MKESEELKAARTEYLAKLTRYGGLPMPATAHYTAGYKDGSNMLWAVAQNCAEVERRLEDITRQRDLAVSALEELTGVWYGKAVSDMALKALAAIKESEV